MRRRWSARSKGGDRILSRRGSVEPFAAPGSQFCHLDVLQNGCSYDPVASVKVRAVLVMVQRMGGLARRTGRAGETVQSYERIGLLREPGRTVGNYRAYAPKDVGRLVVIQRAHGVGFKFDQVRRLLGPADGRDEPCGTIGRRARQHLTEITPKIGDLAALGSDLGNLVDQCGRGPVSDCCTIDALRPAAEFPE